MLTIEFMLQMQRHQYKFRTKENVSHFMLQTQKYPL